MWRSIFLYIPVLTMLAACGTHKIYVKAHPGEACQKDRRAALKPARGIVIVSVDKEYATNIRTVEKFATVDADIAVLPGPRKLVVRYDNGKVATNTHIALSIEARAGHRYLVQSDPLTGPASDGEPWSPRVIDVTDKDSATCWTVHAGKCE